VGDHTLPSRPEPAWQKMAQTPLYGTSQPVDTKKEDRSSTMDGHELIKWCGIGRRTDQTKQQTQPPPSPNASEESSYPGFGRGIAVNRDTTVAITAIVHELMISGANRFVLP